MADRAKFDFIKIQDDRDSHIEFRETSISPDFMKTTVSEALEAN